VLLKPSWASSDHESATADIYAIIPLGAPQAAS